MAVAKAAKEARKRATRGRSLRTMARDRVREVVVEEPRRDASNKLSSRIRASSRLPSPNLRLPILAQTLSRRCK